VVRVLAVVVDVRVQVIAVEDVVEVTHEHVVDHFADAMGQAGGGRTEHMFAGYVWGRTDGLISCNLSCSYPEPGDGNLQGAGKTSFGVLTGARSRTI
jgi:hypothetical protein